MKLRYLTTKCQTTAEQVYEYSQRYDISIKEANKILTNKVGPMLQYWDEEFNDWVDVKFVTEFI